MASHPAIDCVVVGYNDLDFQAFADQQKALEARSGAFHEVRTNSVLLGGKRMLYMDLINNAFAEATGHDPRLNVFESPALGVCYLQHFLRQRNFNATTVNFFTYEKERFRRLLAQSPLAVAITTTFYVDNAPLLEIIKFVREQNPATRIIVGGPHVYNISCDYDEEAQAYVFKDIGADIYIIDSQGELTLSQVLHELRNGANLDDVPNLAYFADGGRELRRTRRAPENNNMDASSIRWETFDADVIAPIAYVRTARSCPFACSFCNYPTLAGSHDLTSLGMIEHELDALALAGTKVVVFIDDTFNVPLPRFKKLLQLMVDKAYDFKWVSFLRCSNVDEAALDLMQASGCTGVLLGIESGDQTILNYMNKSATIDRYRWGIRKLTDRNIASYASFICGFPGETEDTVRNTLDFIEETGPTFFNVQLYYHDFRSPIHRRAKEFEIQGGGYSWHHKTMSWQEAAEWARWTFKNVRNSIPMPLYGFSLWGIAYLVSKGIPMESIASFGRIAREMFIPGLDDIEGDYRDEQRKLAELFKDIRVVPAKGGGGAAVARPSLAGADGIDVRLGVQPMVGRMLPLDAESLDLSPDAIREIRGLAEEKNTAMSIVLLAMFELLLFQVRQHGDMCVHVRLPGRPELPVRSRLAADMEFGDLLRQLNDAIEEARANEHYSLTRVVGAPYPDGETGTVSNVRYTYERGGYGEPSSADGRFDLELHVEERQVNGSLAVRLTAMYARSVFERQTIQHYLETLDRFLRMLGREAA